MTTIINSNKQLCIKQAYIQLKLLTVSSNQQPIENWLSKAINKVDTKRSGKITNEGIRL